MHSLTAQGYPFESETDTETIAKLAKYMYDTLGEQVGVCIASFILPFTHSLKHSLPLSS